MCFMALSATCASLRFLLLISTIRRRHPSVCIILCVGNGCTLPMIGFILSCRNRRCITYHAVYIVLHVNHLLAGLCGSILSILSFKGNLISNDLSRFQTLASRCSNYQRRFSPPRVRNFTVTTGHPSSLSLSRCDICDAQWSFYASL